MVEAESAPRFGLEARVACNCGTWEPGAVIGHEYTVERLDGQVYPYQVRLDDGRLFCVPVDEVMHLRSVVSYPSCDEPRACVAGALDSCARSG